MPPHSVGVTEARRERILWVLWVHGKGNPASITSLLKKHIEGGRLDWPQFNPEEGDSQPLPYETGTRQHLEAMSRDKDARVRRAPADRQHDQRVFYEWNPEILFPRAHALEVLELRRQAHNNKQIAVRLGIGHQLVSLLYHDPFGLREKERKKNYCPGCGKRKEDDQTVCTGCVRRRREAVEDRAESHLPDAEWARSLPLVFPVDFCVDEEYRRFLVIHTERGRVTHFLRRGESWEHAVREFGAIA